MSVLSCLSVVALVSDNSGRNSVKLVVHLSNNPHLNVGTCSVCVEFEPCRYTSSSGDRVSDVCYTYPCLTFYVSPSKKTRCLHVVNLTTCLHLQQSWGLPAAEWIMAGRWSNKEIFSTSTQRRQMEGQARTSERRHLASVCTGHTATSQDPTG